MEILDREVSHRTITPLRASSEKKINKALSFSLEAPISTSA
jgi:hypothetical protein